jgi:hypothetical protein
MKMQSRIEERRRKKKKKATVFVLSPLSLSSPQWVQQHLQYRKNAPTTRLRKLNRGTPKLAEVVVASEAGAGAGDIVCAIAVATESNSTNADATRASVTIFLAATTAPLPILLFVSFFRSFLALFTAIQAP